MSDHDGFASMEKSREGSIFDIVQHSSAVQDVASVALALFLERHERTALSSPSFSRSSALAGSSGKQKTKVGVLDAKVVKVVFGAPTRAEHLRRRQCLVGSLFNFKQIAAASRPSAQDRENNGDDKKRNARPKRYAPTRIRVRIIKVAENPIYKKFDHNDWK